MKNKLGNSSDIIIRGFCSGGQNSVEAAIIYTSGLADTAIINHFIMEPLELNETFLTAGSADAKWDSHLVY
ncbi:hypothetical protein GC098_17585 [Paenibacillus sp. LMG 31458]|uniref:Uncharacterized protein n=1 Tax=Paenibacillus phytorum TaxID=2654977 RepID=A0ABX1XXC7_9BACL|nr:hypothetical protein [Paenibacillus phytorum]